MTLDPDDRHRLAEILKRIDALDVAIDTQTRSCVVNLSMTHALKTDRETLWRRMQRIVSEAIA